VFETQTLIRQAPAVAKYGQLLCQMSDTAQQEARCGGRKGWAVEYSESLGGVRGKMERIRDVC